MSTRRIVIVAYPKAHSLDISGPFEVFSAANDILAAAGRPGYEVGVGTYDGGPITTSSGLQIGAAWRLTDLDSTSIDTLLVAGGRGNRRAAADAALVDTIATLGRQARRVGSVCSGAFVLAATGALDGRPATTHWASTDRLRAEHPALDVRPDAIFTRDGRVWTSAGVTAGMDLALAMVADDHDDELARQVAQWLVIYLRRSGGQSQFSAPVTAVAARRDEIRRAQDRIAADPSGDCSVETLAATAAMSPRHFTRVFRQQVGVTPARYVESCRLDMARSLLESTDLTIADVARRSGTGDPSTLHRLFERRLATTPAAYRSHFRSSHESSTT